MARPDCDAVGPRWGTERAGGGPDHPRPRPRFAKPTLDAEPDYENHPVNPWPVFDPANDTFDDHDVRRQACRSTFAGGCRVTYGHHSGWPFASEREPWINRTALGRIGGELTGDGLSEDAVFLLHASE